MEPLRYTEIAAFKDMEKSIEFYKKYGTFPGKDLKDYILEFTEVVRFT